MNLESRAVRRWRLDPVRFMRDCLGGDRPWWRQVEIAESVRDNRETNVQSGNGCGKDWITARIALWWLFTRPDAVVVTTATKALQVDTILWGEIRAAYKRARIPLGGKLQPVSSQLYIGEKWYAIGLVAKDPNAFAGFHSAYVLGIEDEAAGLAEFIDPAVLGCCVGENDRILRIGNPICGPTHFFAKACNRPGVPGLSRTIRVSTRETPNYVEGRTVIPGLSGRATVEAFERKYGKGSVVVNARVDGLFPGAASDGLISLEHLALSRQRLAAGVGPADADRVRLGCDVARFGDDLTRVYAARGPIAWEVAGSPITKQDGVVIARFLGKTAQDLHAVSIAIDGGGLGAGPLDAIKVLRETGQFPLDVAVHDVQFGAKASDDTQWVDVRCELWWRTRDWLKDAAALDPDEVLEEELLSPTYWMVGKAVRLEPKEDLKKADRLGRSPDAADALVLAVAGHLVGARRKVGTDPQPWELPKWVDPDADEDDVTIEGERVRWGPEESGSMGGLPR